MIPLASVVALATAAPVLPPFAPPLAQTFAYTVSDDFAPPVHSRLVRHETLRFSRASPGYVAALVLVAQDNAASPASRAALDGMLRPLIGVESRLAVDGRGGAGAPIDPDAAWGAFLASRRALLAAIDAGTTGPRVAGRAAVVAEMDTGHRDDRLREPFLALLPPRLPPLAPGEARAFTATIATPVGPLPAAGEVRLLDIGPAMIRYRITVTTSPELGDASAARLRASLPADAPAEARARVEHAAAALAGVAFAETTEFELARPSGLLIRSHLVRETVAADGTRHPFSTREIALTP